MANIKSMTHRIRKQAWQTATWLRSRTGDIIPILGYHRVSATTVDPYGMCVHPDHFAAHLEVLRRETNVITLRELHQHLNEGKLPKRTAVITFDDGYQEFLQIAKPLLEASGLPATLFVVTGALGQEFWWDTLARLIFSPAVMPENLTLQIAGETISWSLLNANPTMLQVDGPSPRYRLLLQIYQRLLKTPEARTAVLSQLQAHVEPAATAPIAPAMTPAELQALAQDDWITIGAHSVSHPALGQLPHTAQQEEIGSSKTRLEALLKRPVSFFSYPHGDSATSVQRNVQESGFQLACTSCRDMVRPRSDPFCLPRFWIPDVDGETFARWLQFWLAN